jgi:hypothetical protein
LLLSVFDGRYRRFRIDLKATLPSIAGAGKYFPPGAVEISRPTRNIRQYKTKGRKRGRLQFLRAETAIFPSAGGAKNHGRRRRGPRGRVDPAGGDGLAPRQGTPI